MRYKHNMKEKRGSRAEQLDGDGMHKLGLTEHKCVKWEQYDQKKNAVTEARQVRKVKLHFAPK